MEQSLIMIKPDGVKQGNIGQIIHRFEQHDYQLRAIKMFTMSQELAKQHYAAHKQKDFFDDLVAFITSGPVVPMVWQGTDIIASARDIIGTTDPKAAKLNTIRADFGTDVRHNAIHGSDSVENAKIEIARFFPDM
ncbi:nucleoside diphosphate kinase [Paraliobacillus ryukyuensis]|uniref:Nucleoside diphosphate kinase n=1 Tax=Paraliobacillus ryukyuensis TaxID=200904 RepID=A0A366EGS2_9BACI|nr:nucleoside-diphosphate kinase [Paraliobacillus ryukyuensis]RBP01533.1 nucleoside diphosphate kinase [Paraliobacillus ryukyuensis]